MWRAILDHINKVSTLGAAEQQQRRNLGLRHPEATTVAHGRAVARDELPSFVSHCYLGNQ